MRIYLPATSVILRAAVDSILGQDFTDFAYYRLEVSGIYFIGGFGVMGWVAASEYGFPSERSLAPNHTGRNQG